MQRVSVGIDIAKEIHWVTAIDADGVVRIDRKLLNTPTDIASLADQLAALGGPEGGPGGGSGGGNIRVGLDVIGGIAGLVEAMLATAGFSLLHVPDLAARRSDAASWPSWVIATATIRPPPSPETANQTRRGRGKPLQESAIAAAGMTGRSRPPRCGRGGRAGLAT